MVHCTLHPVAPWMMNLSNLSAFSTGCNTALGRDVSVHDSAARLLC